MRFILFLAVTISLLSCDDGNFDMLQFNFETTVNTCGSYVLYRTSSERTEALIISLNETDIIQEVGVETIPITATNVTYRIFNESLGTDYFCATIPPTSPTVLKEWTAISGVNNMITIDTTEIINETDGAITGYKHNLVFTNLVLENEGVQEKYVTYVFGSFNTSLP